MESVHFIVEGFLIGLLCSIPLGPMGVLIIRKTLNKGVWYGFFSGIGVALADLFYASVVALGLNLVVENIVVQHQLLIRVLGGLVIVIMGVIIYFKNPLKSVQPKIGPASRLSKSRLTSDMLSLFFLTVTNPVAIVIFMGAFGATNVLVTESGEQICIEYKICVLAGLFMGGLTWWYFLSSLVNLFRGKFNMQTLVIMNKAVGIILAIIGIFAVLSIFETVGKLFEMTNLPVLGS